MVKTHTLTVLMATKVVSQLGFKDERQRKQRKDTAMNKYWKLLQALNTPHRAGH